MTRPGIEPQSPRPFYLLGQWAGYTIYLYTYLKHSLIVMYYLAIIYYNNILLHNKDKLKSSNFIVLIMVISIILNVFHSYIFKDLQQLVLPRQSHGNLLFLVFSWKIKTFSKHYLMKLVKESNIILNKEPTNF